MPGRAGRSRGRRNRRRGRQNERPRGQSARKPRDLGSNEDLATTLDSTAQADEETPLLDAATSSVEEGEAGGGLSALTGGMLAGAPAAALAELFIQGFTIDLQPTRVPVGGDVDIRFTVANSGPASVGEAAFSILQGTQEPRGGLGGSLGGGGMLFGLDESWELESGVVRDVPAGGSQTVVQRATVPEEVPPGTSTEVQVVVDPDDAISEESELNNSSLLFGSTLEVVGRGEAEGAGDLPDLEPTDAGLDDRGRLWLELRNAGAGALPSSHFGRVDVHVEVCGWREDLQVEDILFDRLAEAGGAAGLTTDLRPDQPDEVRVEVDPRQGVFESDESNNVLVRYLDPAAPETVGPAAGTIAATSLLSPAQREQPEEAGEPSPGTVRGADLDTGGDFPARITSVDSPVRAGEPLMIRGDGFGDREGTVVISVRSRGPELTPVTRVEADRGVEGEDVGRTVLGRSAIGGEVEDEVGGEDEGGSGSIADLFGSKVEDERGVASVTCDLIEWGDRQVDCTVPRAIGRSIAEEGTEAIVWLRPASTGAGEGPYPYSGEEGPRHPVLLLPDPLGSISAGISMTTSSF